MDTPDDATPLLKNSNSYDYLKPTGDDGVAYLENFFRDGVWSPLTSLSYGKNYRASEKFWSETLFQWDGPPPLN